MNLDQQQVCMTCGWRKNYPHPCACPHCFPVGMIFERAWLHNSIIRGYNLRPVPPVRQEQREQFTAIAVEAPQNQGVEPLQNEDLGDQVEENADEIEKIVHPVGPEENFEGLHGDSGGADFPQTSAQLNLWGGTAA